MSASEQGDNNAILTGIQSLLRKAYSVAQRAYKAIIASNNFSATVSAVDIGPALGVEFSAPPITTTVGTTVRIVATMSGTAAAVDQVVGAELRRGGTGIGGAPTFTAGHATADWAVTLEWIDTVALGTYTYSMLCTSAGNITAQTGKCAITVEERPAP